MSGLGSMHPSEFDQLRLGDHPGKSLRHVRDRLRAQSPDYYQALRDDIDANGVQDPVLLRRGRGGRHTVMDGHNRLSIAHELGRPVPVGDYDNPEHYELGSGSQLGREWWRKRNELGARRASKPRASEKPQSCNWCSEPATRSLLWAEGKAYIPSCDRHLLGAYEHVRREYGDKPDAVHTVRKSAIREPGSVNCWACKGTGDDDQGGECPSCDGSGYLTPSEQRMAVLGYRPVKRIFGPTYGLDERLFDGEHFKPAVRHDLMAKWHRFCAEQGLAQPDEWSIVYFAGSEASEWTSPERKGNNDFDVLVGVDVTKLEATNPGEMHDMGVETDSPEEIAHELTSRMRETLVDPAYVLPGGNPDDPWDQTWYVNPNSYHIADIKPYAAYDVTHDVWAVKPPHLPDWDISKFPQGEALAQMGDAYDDLIKAIMRLPEPHRTQQGNALWEHLHSDRSRAFSENGEGWWDTANVMEKWLDQEGTWKDLWELHHRAEEDPASLRAPADWSNQPGAPSRTG